jgi:hypothetical protein
MSPTTALGQLITTVAQILGILTLAMPVTVLGANFDSQFDRLNENKFSHDMDSFKALRLGVKFYENTLPEDSPARKKVQEELHKLSVAETMMVTDYNSSKGESDRKTERRFNELEELVKTKIGGLEDRLTKVLLLLENTGAQTASSSSSQMPTEAVAEAEDETPAETVAEAEEETPAEVEVVAEGAAEEEHEETSAEAAAKAEDILVDMDSLIDVAGAKIVV